MKQLTVSSQKSTKDPLADVDNFDKVSKDPVYNSKNYYHNGYWQSLNWDDWTCK